MECRYNLGSDADVLFAINPQDEAIKATKDFGEETVVVRVNRVGDKERIFTASYQIDLGIED